MRFLVVGYDRSVGARVERELQGEFGDAEVVLVFDQETMGRLLEEGRPDAVITEFQLPWGDALREIDRVRES